MDHHGLPILRRNSEAGRQSRVELPLAGLQLIDPDVRIGRRMIAVLVHEENSVEHLLRQVRIHGGRDVRNNVQVAINKAAEPHVIIGGAVPAASGHEQFKPGNAKSVLHIHQEQPNLAF